LKDAASLSQSQQAVNGPPEPKRASRKYLTHQRKSCLFAPRARRALKHWRKLTKTRHAA
jgi:hypothetical protein